MIFGIFTALAEFEREMIRERTMARLAAARGRKGDRKYELSKTKARLAQAAMGNRESGVTKLCKELVITRNTLYRYVGPKGELREHGKKVLDA